ncbi:hypothetical protein [Micromonospora chokoriensis]|uniref:hypothetical protein n=1 Tax=Micromonospora chokoriensis TaxID=356851 RepID=UPI0012FBFB54|nr:hypothetical protein [Micromonospora chokoriensis]
MNAVPVSEIPAFIRQEFSSRGNVRVIDVSVKAYPDETNYIVLVEESDLPVAAQIGNDLDDEISSPSSRAFVIVRKAPRKLVEDNSSPLVLGVQDDRALDLMRLISARSRVSEAQPSLSYVRDAHLNLPAVTAPRHHLIFGRRGAGKSALLVEARSTLKPESAISCWINMQTLRSQQIERVFVYVVDEIVSTVLAKQQQIRSASAIAVLGAELYEQTRSLLARQAPLAREEADRLVPEVQRLLKRFLEASGLRIFIFIDDFYYLPRIVQPSLLDMLHGCVRDCDAWLKIASIRHLTRWFQSSPPLGLQTGHDAELLDLDVTLQDPARAKSFLENILFQYARRVGVPTLTRLFHGAALDRLVLASGAVPRDYLILAGSSISKAQRRPNAKLVGVQDVNQAAGDAAQVKVQELEEDMAANVASATRTVEALKRVRNFCLEDSSYTYFLVGYREKEDWPHRYNILTDLLDQRLIHLVDGGVSDPHAAGHRSEAFMLDLSQFSGSRLKQGIRVLDFVGGRIVSRKTRGANVPGSDRTGNTPLRVIAILRGAPTFPLHRLSDLADEPSY